MESGAILPVCDVSLVIWPQNCCVRFLSLSALHFPRASVRYAFVYGCAPVAAEEPTETGLIEMPIG
jgi:hypothetical protein